MDRGQRLGKPRVGESGKHAGRDPASIDDVSHDQDQEIVEQPVERFLGFRQRAASRCRLLEGAAWQRSRAKSWKITSGSGAVTMIYETDLLNDTADYHDFDLAKLAVSVPHPDPLPQRRDTEPTGARTIR